MTLGGSLRGTVPAVSARAWTLAGSLGLHAMVVVGWVLMSSQARSVESSSHRGPTPAALQVRTIAASPALVSPANTAAAAAASPIELAAAPPERGAPAAGGRDAPGYHYSVDEVDTPAAPRSDWDVDIASLLSRNVAMVSFEVQVSDTGRLERCKVIQIQPPAASLEEPLASRLCKTRATPAIRRGVAVPSVRRIELVLAP